ncbi:Uncharacterized protein dnm_000930 [Desulfonema magnum]|uniref:Uncharacterized protein n=1 Tax=Desulfonema magnum TaxID=45655 RepID=A0A975BFH2_9BACT|nr:Uncharacterized protein dnm_000930 [Desulfonema magnum]
MNMTQMTAFLISITVRSYQSYFKQRIRSEFTTGTYYI